MKASENEFPRVVLVDDADTDATDPGMLALVLVGGVLHTVDESGTLAPVGASAIADILELATAETDDTLRLAPDGAGGVEWAAGGGGGGMTHSYIGYPTAGGSIETAGVNAKVYAKSVTLAADSYLASIGAYLQIASASHGAALGVAVYTDVAGAPGLVIAAGQGKMGQLALNATTPRWFHSPVGVWLPAGTYWIAVRLADSGGSVITQINYDGSGADRTATGASEQWADWARLTPTTTSNRYSIRADVFDA